jgi:Family of unknown function (DUF6518)
MPSADRLVRVLLAALGFGLVAAWAKGQGGVSHVAELRSDLGNLSTPWVLVAFLAGTTCSRLRSGALLGLIATALGLISFYLWNTIVQDLGGNGFLDELRIELTANRGYLEGGLVSGPLFGALGAWWTQTRSRRASVLAGVLLMAEPLVLLVLGTVVPGYTAPAGLPQVLRLVPGWGLGSESRSIALGVYAAEFVIGLCLVLLATRRPARSLRSG